MKKVLSDNYLNTVGTVVESNEEFTVVRYEYNGVVEFIAWPTEELKEVEEPSREPGPC